MREKRDFSLVYCLTVRHFVGRSTQAGYRAEHGGHYFVGFHLFCRSVIVGDVHVIVGQCVVTVAFLGILRATIYCTLQALRY